MNKDSLTGAGPYALNYDYMMNLLDGIISGGRNYWRTFTPNPYSMWVHLDPAAEGSGHLSFKYLHG